MDREEVLKFFPPFFSLPAFPGEKLRVNPSKFAHFYSDYDKSFQVVVQILGKDGEWRDLGRDADGRLLADLKEIVFEEKK